MHRVHDLVQTKYKQVIDIIFELKENKSFERFDVEIEEQLQGYLCRALARQMDKRFDSELGWFKERLNKDRNYHSQFHFLCGFNSRLSGDYKNAVEEYLKVLSYSPNRRAARRELVAAYMGMEDYDTCIQYAKLNFEQDSSNKYYIQSYFNALIHQDKTEERDKDIKYVMDALNAVYSFGDNKDSIYFEVNAKYDLFINHNREAAFNTIRDGEKVEPDSPFLLMTEFDFYEYLKDKKGMRDVLDKMEHLLERRKDNNQTKVAYRRRIIIYEAYTGVGPDVLKIKIDELKGLSSNAKLTLLKKVEKIKWELI